MNAIAKVAAFARKTALIATLAAGAVASLAPAARADWLFSGLSGLHTEDERAYTPRQSQRAYTPRSNYSYSSYDRGGNVLDYFEQVREANVSRRAVAIDGYCASACTMKLAARNVCVSPWATLRFHSASSYGANSAAGNTLLMAVYPRAIRHWVRRHHALASQSFTDMSGSQAIALGVPRCSVG